MGCCLDRKSTYRTCQFLETSLVFWSLRKHSNIAQSSIGVEYVVAASTSARSVAKNHVLHSKTKHIDVRFPLF
jgi:hypothetical protein